MDILWCETLTHQGCGVHYSTPTLEVYNLCHLKILKIYNYLFTDLLFKNTKNIQLFILKLFGII